MRHYKKMPLPKFLTPVGLCLLLSLASPAFAGSALEYSLNYLFDFSVAKKQVEVTITLEQDKQLRLLDFNLEGSQCKHFKSSDKLVKKGQRLEWTPASKVSQLKYRCVIDHNRPSRDGKLGYDARMEKDWAIFRGDDLVPPVKVIGKKRASSKARLLFRLPENWQHVNTGWRRIKTAPFGQGLNAAFAIENAKRRFDRPTGWMIAGDLATRRDTLGTTSKTDVAVSAPRGSGFRRMDTLVFLGLLWPEIEATFHQLPQKLLIVSGDDPLWRGGLSAGNSFFMHSSRPLISENATSTLVHELVHTFSGLRGKPGNDWIVEGIAEFYSSSLLYRAGGINQARYAGVIKNQKKRAGNKADFRQLESKFAVKAAAANFFYQLDMHIRQKSKSQHSLDEVVGQLMRQRVVDIHDLERAVKKVSPKSLALFERFDAE